MRPTAVLRFDVDTELCLREGVGPLCSVAQRYGVPLTFFINPGRAIDRALLMREVVTRRRNGIGSERAPALGAIAKLGRRETIRLLALNPTTLPGHARVVRRLAEAGHEIGLHGGRNHAAWQRGAFDWDRKRLVADVTWGKRRLEAATGSTVSAFASPGWTSPRQLPGVLKDLGFEILADERDSAGIPHGGQEAYGGLVLVPNTLAGEPGGVGYLESLHAAGMSDAEALSELEGVLARRPSFLCLYDHPFYAGRHALELFGGVIERLLRNGYRIKTVGQAARGVTL